MMMAESHYPLYLFLLLLLYVSRVAIYESRAAAAASYVSRAAADASYVSCVALIYMFLCSSCSAVYVSRYPNCVSRVDIYIHISCCSIMYVSRRAAPLYIYISSAAARYVSRCAAANSSAAIYAFRAPAADRYVSRVSGCNRVFLY